MSHVKTIADEWKEFCEGPMHRVHPQSMQYKEIQKAFYAGAASMFICMSQVTEIDDDRVGAELVARLNKEVELFFENLMKRHAEEN